MLPSLNYYFVFKFDRIFKFVPVNVDALERDSLPSLFLRLTLFRRFFYSQLVEAAGKFWVTANFLIVESFIYFYISYFGLFCTGFLDSYF